MKEKKKMGLIIAIVVLIVVITSVIIQVVLNSDTKRLEEEGKKYETLTVTTKSGLEVETEYTHVENHTFYFKIPKEFQTLDDEMIHKKYHGEVPDIVFSNQETTINLAISMTENKMEDSQIKTYRKQMEALLKDSATIIESVDKRINHHTVGRLKLITSAEDTNIYNDMIFFSENGKLVIMTFNTTEELMEEWSSVGDFLIDSLFFQE